LKKRNSQPIVGVIIATGISSVVTQLVTIREFLTQFQGNEIVIALILFNWLVLGGFGTLVSRIVTRRFREASAGGLGWLSLVLCFLAPLQILAIRQLRDMVFIHGSSVGFYPTWLFTFCTIAPYCLLLGFVLPYSLFALRAAIPGYPGARVYITDNIGDICGGALFSFALVYLVTPLSAILLSHLPLLAAVYFLFPALHRHRPAVLIFLILTAVALATALFFEKKSLAPPEGKLVYYRETRYGRVTVQRDKEQFTLFEDGNPVSGSQNLSLAEETIHYPLSQIEDVEHVLLISAESGVMTQLKKYPLATIDYVELNPAVSSVQFRFGLMASASVLKVIHIDGRAYLEHTEKVYDAVIVNLPEPDTFQINRFYTKRFFELAAKHLNENGILSFTMEGFDNYLAEPQKQKLSSLYNTAKKNFKNVLLLPGQKVFFLCSDGPLTTDIPAALEHKGIATDYIGGFYYGNLSAERIERLNGQMDRTTPVNTDLSPYLMRLMFRQWFAKFQTSPLGFFIVLGLLTLIYLFRISREEFVIFSTGFINMGSEILVVFAFQIFFGYIYFQIGIIITVFLAGLLPGAWLGNRLHRSGKRTLALTDGFLVVLPVMFIIALMNFGDRLPTSFFLGFGFLVSLTCGFQFPVALYLRGSGAAAAARTFSADLIGAAAGTLFTSVVLVPYTGITGGALGLTGLKLVSTILSLTRRS
jgi:spermidine synthase